MPKKSTNNPNPAIVIGLDCMTGIQTARILAGHGVPVIALAGDTGHFACRTRVCRRIIQADIKSEALIAVLAGLGPKLKNKAVLFPCTDLSVALLSQHRDRLSDWFHIALPEDGIVQMMQDKIAFYRFAQERGLPVPMTRLLHSRAQALETARDMNYPCILKPPVRSAAWDSHMDEKVYKVFSAEELMERYDQGSQWSDSILVQEWIPGSDAHLYSCNCYFDQAGRPQATFIARKLRQWPPQAGTSCLGEECRNDEVLTTSIRLFEAVGYRGLGYVEMKRHAETGRQYIIEPNIGRPTGRSAIAEAGGVELLMTKYCDLVGRPLPRRRTQAYRGVKWIYLRRDLQSAFYYWRHGELSLWGWLRSMRGPKAFAVLSVRDPLPFVFDFLGKAAQMLAGPKKRTAAAAAENDFTTVADMTPATVLKK